MTDKARIRIAAAITALFLAGISAAGLAARDHPRRAAATAAAPSIATPAPNATAAARGDDDRYDGEDYEEAEDDE
jgi:hypothetical protein